MFELKNNTPFKSVVSMGVDTKGEESLFVAIKATFDLWPTLSVSKDQLTPQMEDVYWGDPGESSLKYASDLHMGKVATDIALIGSAWAPEGKPVSELMVGLAVGDCRKRLSIFGDRCWDKGGVSAPQTFTKLPLTYERSWGGSTVKIDGDGNEALSTDERNPVGIGYSIVNADADINSKPVEPIDGEPLPNIEIPADLLPDEPLAHQTPTGLGFIAGHWLPRKQYLGTWDDQWRKKKAPFFPDDFDQRFYSSASPGLVCDDWLQGGELVQLVHLAEQSRYDFLLPENRLSVFHSTAKASSKLRPLLETVLIEPDENRLCLVWKAKLKKNQKHSRLGAINVEYH